MGLDMYLSGKKYLPNNWENPAKNVMEDGYRVQERVLELGYWRKHPNLHGFIVQTFANGDDDCTAINLSPDNLRTIIEAVKSDKLPRTDGFFFGSSDWWEDKKPEVVETLEKALAWSETKEDGTWRIVEYQASW